MGKWDDLIRLAGGSVGHDPQRFRALMAARRRFDAKPVSLDDVEAGKISPKSFLEFSAPENEGLRGVYVGRDLGQMRKWGVTQPTALYAAGNRGARRHEVMHGINDMVSADPALSAAVPWWARGAQGSEFADELLARLASGQRGQFLDWPMHRYATHGRMDRVAYGVARPVQSVGRAARDNPEALALAALAAGAAVGVPLALSMSDEEEARATTP